MLSGSLARYTLPSMPANGSTKLEKLLISEVSGVDDPANELPGWAVLKSKTDPYLIPAFEMEAFTKASDSKKPYGDVEYADNGLQEDGKKRYPLDTETHIRAAWSYINQEDNAKLYSAADLKTVKGKIAAAMKRIGADINTETTKASTGDATTILARVRKLVAGGKEDDFDMEKSEVEAMLKESNAALIEQVSDVVKSLIPTAPAEGEGKTDEGAGGVNKEVAAPAAEAAPAAPAAPAAEAETPAITPDDIAKSVSAALEPYNEILEKVLDRLERVEGRSAARKSLDGQEGGSGAGDADETPTVKSAVLKALAGQQVILT